MAEGQPMDAETTQPVPESEVRCPLLDYSEDGRAVCASRSGQPIAISPRYVETYCTRLSHRECSLYRHTPRFYRAYRTALRSLQDNPSARTEEAATERTAAEPRSSTVLDH